MRRYDSRDTLSTIGKVWRNAEFPLPTYPHSFHSIEEPWDHHLSVDAQLCDQQPAIFLEFGGIKILSPRF